MVSNGTHAVLDSPHSHMGLEGLIIKEQVPKKEKPVPAINYDFGEDNGDLIGRTIGTGKVTLNREGCLILGPGSVYRFSNNPRVVRSPLHREFYHREHPTNLLKMIGQALVTRAKRGLLGEEAVLNAYQAMADGALLEMSTDTIGEGLYRLQLEEGRAIIARKGIWFGMERDVRMDIEVPLITEIRAAKTLSEIENSFLRAAYGPGPILQRFSAMGEQNGVIFNFGGSWNEEKLKEGQRSDHYDPCHVYAWDTEVKLRIIPYGSRSDLFTQPKEMRHYIEFEGPGRVWHSNGAYTNGYIGNWFRPASWTNTLIGVPGRLFNLLNNPVKPF